MLGELGVVVQVICCPEEREGRRMAKRRRCIVASMVGERVMGSREEVRGESGRWGGKEVGAGQKGPPGKKNGLNTRGHARGLTELFSLFFLCKRCKHPLPTLTTAGYRSHPALSVSVCGSINPAIDQGQVDPKESRRLERQIYTVE
jgi:hypothetical protein